MINKSFKSVDSIIYGTIPTAMIDGLRRRLAKSIDRDPWDANQELRPETEEPEISHDAALITPATGTNDVRGTNEIDTFEYYKSLVRAAIENGGKHNGHEIPVPWLRMVLAGLEYRRIDPEAMWYGVEETGLSSGPPPELPPFEDLFPSDRDAPTGPGPR